MKGLFNECFTTCGSCTKSYISYIGDTAHVHPCESYLISVVTENKAFNSLVNMFYTSNIAEDMSKSTDGDDYSVICLFLYIKLTLSFITGEL